jgi:sec-independent protein translocase protein TatC
MNLLGIGLIELFLIFVIAFVFPGPSRTAQSLTHLADDLKRLFIRVAGFFKGIAREARINEKNNVKRIDPSISPMLGYLEGLRKHIVRSVIAFALSMLISIYFVDEIMGYLITPYLEAFHLGNMAFSLLSTVRVAIITGLVIIFPYIAFEITLFLSPGLQPRERRMLVLIVPLLTLMLLMGGAFSWFVFFPALVPVMESVDSLRITYLMNADVLLSLFLSITFWIALLFAYPLFIYFLTAYGIVSPGNLAKKWRIAIFYVAVLSALVTSGDTPLTMLCLLSVVSLFYFIAIGLSQIAWAGRTRRPGP